MCCCYQLCSQYWRLSVVSDTSTPHWLLSTNNNKSLNLYNVFSAHSQTPCLWPLMLGWGWKFSSQISRHGEEIIKQKILVYLENPQQPHSDIYFDVLQVFNQCFYLWALASKEFLFIWNFLCVTQQLFSIAVRSWYQITNSWWNLSWFILLQEWSRFSDELLMLSSQTRFCCQNILYFSVWSYEPIIDYNPNISLTRLTLNCAPLT